MIRLRIGEIFGLTDRFVTTLATQNFRFSIYQ